MNNSVNPEEMSSRLFADVILGGRYGDEGKGKVTSELLTSGNYNYCIRFNGGSNAGGSLYFKGKKYIVHTLPVGIVTGMKSIIGPGCVVNYMKIKSELEDLRKQGITEWNLLISDRAHVVLDSHLEQERKESKIGTTRQGIGPCYTDKYSRTGSTVRQFKPQFESIPGVKVIDLYTEFKEMEKMSETKRVGILFQGVQGLGLDIDHGHYPFVTSSSCGISGVLTSGVPMKWIRNVYGIIKAYDTYVGLREFQDPEEKLLEVIQEVGKERGNTTGRPRQCNWLDLDETKAAFFRNGITHVIVNKVDILQEVNVFRYILGGKIVSFDNYSEWKENVERELKETGVESVVFSGNPEKI